VREFVVVLKASKFCNLRCAYCYEYRELHVRDIMRMETLQRLFADVDGFGAYLNERGISAAEVKTAYGEDEEGGEAGDAGEPVVEAGGPAVDEGGLAIDAGGEDAGHGEG